MPWPADHSARRRDQALARTRRLSLWVAGGAATASMGLGTAFAHALPGHGAPAVSAQPGRTQPPAIPSQITPPASGAPPSPAGQQPASGTSAAPSPAATHLAQPSQAPAATPAPAQTASGGS
jgi:hypothetical protein